MVQYKGKRMGSLINDVYRLQNANNQAQAAVAKTPAEPKPAIVPAGDTKNINRPDFKDEFLKQHRKNGLIERFYKIPQTLAQAQRKF